MRNQVETWMSGGVTSYLTAVRCSLDKHSLSLSAVEWADLGFPRRGDRRSFPEGE